MAGVPPGKAIPLEGWPRGIDNKSREDAVDARAVRAAVNVDFDAAGKASRRPGYGLALAEAGLHSLYAEPRWPLLMAGTASELLSFDSTLRRTSHATLTTDAPLSYATVGDRLFYCNGRDSGLVLADGTRHAWAPEGPGGQPTLSVNPSAGGLTAGMYQLAITFVDSLGRESGASLAEVISVAEGQGIVLSNFPVPSTPGTQSIRVYCSPANGDVLYLAQEIPVGLSQFLLGRHTPGRALETQFLEPMPAGHIVRAQNGRLHVAHNDMHLWSAALHYGMHKRHTSYTRYEARLTLLEPVGEGDRSGVYVATAQRTYFLSGASPEAWRRNYARGTGAVEGSAMQLDGEDLDIEGLAGRVAAWMDSDGNLVVGTPSGQVIDLHDTRYRGKDGVEFARLAMRERLGQKHLVATMRGGAASTFRASDRVEAEVWKNGVRIS